MSSLLALLGSSPLAAGLDAPALARLTHVLTEERFADGAAVFAEGETGDALFVVREGSARVTKQVGPERSVIVAELPPGQVVGEMSILSAQPRSTGCAAVGPTVLLKLDRSALAGLAAGDRALHDQVVFNLTVLVCRRLGAVMGRVAETLEELRRTGERRASVQERFERSRAGLAGFLSDLLG